MKQREIYLPAFESDKPYLVLAVGQFGATVALIKQGTWWDNFPELKIDDLGHVAVEQVTSIGYRSLGVKIGNDTLYSTLSEEKYNAIISTISDYYLGKITTSDKGLQKVVVEEKKPKAEKPKKQKILYKLYESQYEPNTEKPSAPKMSGYANKRSFTKMNYREDGYTFEEVEIISKMAITSIQYEYKVPYTVAATMRKNAINIIQEKKPEQKRKVRVNYKELFDNGFTPEEIVSAYNVSIHTANQRYQQYCADKESDNDYDTKLKYKKAIVENDILLLLYACKHTIVSFCEANKCSTALATKLLKEIKMKLNENILFAAGFEPEIAFAAKPLENKNLNGYEKEIISRLIDLDELFSITLSYHAKMSIENIPPQVSGIPAEDLNDLISVCKSKFGMYTGKKISKKDEEFIYENSTEDVARKYLLPSVRAKSIKAAILKKKRGE